MAVELRVEGQGLKKIQRDLKEFQDGKAIKRELYKSLRDSAKPLLNDARLAARSELPQAGGLAAQVAARPMSVSITQGGVRIRVRGMDARSTNRGRLRHPVYGNRERWVTQEIKPEWFTNAMRSNADKVRPDLLRAMDRAAQRIAAS